VPKAFDPNQRTQWTDFGKPARRRPSLAFADHAGASCFPAFALNTPLTEKSIAIGGISYLWAGLLGATYGWRTGFGSIRRAMIATALFGLGVFLALWAIRVVPGTFQTVVVICLVPIVVGLHGMVTIAIVREGFKWRRWCRYAAD
jgi:hypothetical protein